MCSLLWSWLFERKHLGYAFGLGGTETRPRITVHLVLVVRETIQRKRQNATSESTSTSFVLVQRKKLNGIKTEHLHHLFWFASLVLVELKRVHETPPWDHITLTFYSLCVLTSAERVNGIIYFKTLVKLEIAHQNQH